MIKLKDIEIKPYFGSQWWAITPECARYIIKTINDNKEIDKHFKYSFALDEKITMLLHLILNMEKIQWK